MDLAPGSTILSFLQATFLAFTKKHATEAFTLVLCSIGLWYLVKSIGKVYHNMKFTN